MDPLTIVCDKCNGAKVIPEVFCGSDLTSLESTTKRHYMFNHDPDYVAEMSEEGFDEHLNLATFAGATTQEDVEGYKVAKVKEKKGERLSDWEQSLYSSVSDIRQQYKQVNYSGIYGIGKNKLARELSIPLKVAAKLLKTIGSVTGLLKRW